MEAEVEMVWQATTNENRRIKESILDYKHNSSNRLDQNRINLDNASYYKLLIDD